MKKNRILFVVLALVACMGLLSGCGSGASTDAGDGRVSIVCTTFPIYSWVQEIIKGNEDAFDVTLLLDNGVDLHNYQPTAEDITRIGTCDIFIYVGGESDEWVEDALKEKQNKNLAAVSLLDSLGDTVKEEEAVEGMETEEEEGAGEEETEYDEHVWLSLKCAGKLVGVISEEIQKADSEHASVYAGNCDAYTEQLNALDEEYGEAVRQAKYHALVFGDRFPFRYLADDYGLQYYAAFAGCSAETEASFQTVTFLAGKADELGVPAIVKIEGSDGRIAETIQKNTKAQNQKIVEMDSMQSVTGGDDTTYLEIMRENLEVLKQALNDE